MADVVVGCLKVRVLPLFSFFFLSLSVVGCSTLEWPGASAPTLTRRTTPTFPANSTGVIQSGMASWYGPGFHGKLTANGEVYNQHDLTAAHRTLPLGTRVMVTNANTNQAIEVRINDRGPYVGDRLIDLSYAAARSIGVYGPGVAPVRLEVLAPVAPVLSVAYAVQLGSYADASQASALKSRMTGRYPDVYISPMDTGLKRYYLVRIGPFTRREEALSRAEDIAQTGMQVIVVEEDDRWAEG
jgi:rare lipoprotein A